MHALDRTADAMHAVRRVGEHERHVGAERLDQQQQHDQVEAELQIVVGGHSNHSGLSSATVR